MYEGDETLPRNADVDNENEKMDVPLLVNADESYDDRPAATAVVAAPACKAKYVGCPFEYENI